jgi:hypothetical protein
LRAIGLFLQFRLRWACLYSIRAECLCLCSQW